MSTRQMDRGIESKRIFKGTVIGKETYDEKPYAIVVYESGAGTRNKVVIRDKDLTTYEARDRIGSLIGAEIDFIITGYDENQKTYTGSRLAAKEILKEIMEEKASIGDVLNVRVIALAKNHIIVDIYGLELKIKSKDLKTGWVEDARETVKLGDKIRVRITNIEPLEVEVITGKETFEAEKYKIGNEYLAKVIGTPKFGIICEIEGERQVMCYIPDWRESVQIGQYVVIQINDVNVEEKRTYGYIKRRIRK